MTDDATDERLAALEAALAHQERTVDDLNAVVTAQAGEIAALTKRMEALVARFLVVEEATRGETPVDRPPHW